MTENIHLNIEEKTEENNMEDQSENFTFDLSNFIINDADSIPSHNCVSNTCNTCKKQRKINYSWNKHHNTVLKQIVKGGLNTNLTHLNFKIVATKGTAKFLNLRNPN